MEGARWIDLFLQRRKKITVEQWLDQWMEHQQLVIKESSYATYQTMIENHIKPSLGKRPLSQITKRELQNFLNGKIQMGRIDKKGGLSLKTVQTLEVLIKAALNAAMEEGIIPVSLLKFQLPPDRSVKESHVFLPEQQTRLYHYAKEANQTKAAGLLLTLNTGVRIGEICALQWSDIDLENGFIRIHQTVQRICIKKGQKTQLLLSAPKTPSSNRIIPLNQEMITLLAPLKKSPAAFFLTGKLNFMEPRSYRGWYARTLKRLSIGHLHFHCLRHTFATRCIECGIDVKTVSELLGHSSVTMTLSLYVHPQMDHKKKCIELLSHYYTQQQASRLQT